MNKVMIAVLGLLLTGSAAADDVSKSNRMLCSISKVLVCFEGVDCLSVLPFEVGVPRFIIVDVKKKLLTTTKASAENRSTPVANVLREEGRILLQGVEQGRAYGILIDEESGELTGAVARDALTVSAFGACTDTDI